MNTGPALEIGNRLIEVLVPSGGIMVALTEFYADESESGGIFTVAGYVYTKEGATALNLDWAQILKDHPKLDGTVMPFFHTVDCVHGEGHFEGWPKGSPDKMAREIIPAIGRHAACGISVSFNLAHIQKLPTSKQLFGAKITPYAVCAYFILYGVRRWVDENYPDAQIAYFYEAGRKGSGQAGVILICSIKMLGIKRTSKWLHMPSSQKNIQAQYKARMFWRGIGGRTPKIEGME